MSRVADRATAWVYRGVWGALVRYLRVPDEPPGVPPGGGQTPKVVRPAPGFLSYLKFLFWLALVAIDVLIIGIWVGILIASPLAGAITAPFFWGIAIIPDILAYVALHVRYDTTWYVITDRSVRIRRGVWIIRENTITFENVQNVAVHQGPVQRAFGIANVTIQTAGGGGAGPHGQSGASGHSGLLEGVDDAPALRDLITARVKSSRHAGLGDDAREPEPARGIAPAHVALLREIHAALR